MITDKISLQIWAQDNNSFRMILKKFRQKWLVKKSKFVWRKKKPPRAQIFRYFRIESRNNNLRIIITMPQKRLNRSWSRVYNNIRDKHNKISVTILEKRLQSSNIYAQKPSKLTKNSNNWSIKNWSIKKISRETFSIWTSWNRFYLPHLTLLS